MRELYPQPHRRMYEAWHRGKGVRLSADELDRLFSTDDAILAAATQERSDDPVIIDMHDAEAKKRKEGKK